MKRMPALGALAVSLALATGAAGLAGSAVGASAGHPATHSRSVAKGSPGKWTKVSTGTSSIIFEPTLVRGPDGVLHLVYEKVMTGNAAQYGHTAIHTDGTIARQNNVLPTPWATLEPTPVVLSTGAGLRVVFGGQRDINPGFWSDGRMYTATADSGGETWSLPAEAVGISHSASASYGTGAVTLGDGTPVAAFPLNSTLTWHVGTGSDPDHTYTAPACCLYRTTLVRDGNAVWAAWYANGGTPSTDGIFVKQLLPTEGPVSKAPGSSNGSSVEPDDRVALAARSGGGVYAAYCVGYPSCTSLRLWKVGTSKTATVPHTRFAASVAISPGPSGRLWIAWYDNLPKVRAVRTGVNGMSMGAVQTAGLPKGGAAYALAIDGTRGRGDIVLNDGNGFWHTQVLAGLTLHASPKRWRHGSRQKVVFKVTDAHDAVKRSKVRVGSDSCRTDRHGTCSITFPASFAKGRHTATATKAGYARATTGLKVR